LRAAPVGMVERSAYTPSADRKEKSMPHQKAMLREIADALSSGGDRRIEAWFTEDFRLHEPGFPDSPSGHRGASEMLERILSLGPTMKLQALDMLEDGNRVAVRWRLSATRDEEAFDCAIMAMYRFENGRIAEDWGIISRERWP
jgi:predicted SnoaL-like aldol condensation-catalyzing enzyme